MSAKNDRVAPAPITGSDVQMFAAENRMKVGEACAALNLTRAAWGAITKSGAAPVEDPALAILIRLYRKHPELLPRQRNQTLRTLFMHLGGEDAVSPRLLALLMGREQTAGNRWFVEGKEVQGRGALQQLMLVLHKFTYGRDALSALTEAAHAESDARELDVFVNRRGWGKAGEEAVEIKTRRKAPAAKAVLRRKPAIRRKA